MFDGRLDGIAVRTFLAPTCRAVQADPEAMKRAIANLVDNAAEAMHDSLVKEIVISTALLDDRDAVEIVVADTGHGVTSEVKEKLFLPYFSTKTRGTGLGLAIVSRIVRRSRGSIRVEENSPVGARFIVELPAGAGDGLRRRPPIKMQTILIVDDESADPQRAAKACWRMRATRRCWPAAAKNVWKLLRQQIARRGAAGYLAARHRWSGDAGEAGRAAKIIPKSS